MSRYCRFTKNLSKLHLTPKKLRTIEGGKQLHGDWAWPLNYQLSTTDEWSIKGTVPAGN